MLVVFFGRAHPTDVECLALSTFVANADDRGDATAITLDKVLWLICCDCGADLESIRSDFIILNGLLLFSLKETLQSLLDDVPGRLHYKFSFVFGT